MCRGVLLGRRSMHLGLSHLDEAHEFVHDVAVVVRWPKCVLRHSPAGREDHKVGHRRAWKGAVAGGGEGGTGGMMKGIEGCTLPPSFSLRFLPVPLPPSNSPPPASWAATHPACVREQ